MLYTLWLGMATLPALAQQPVADRLDASEPLRSAVWGALAVNGRGDTLAALHPDRKLVPASNMKLITTGTALHLLGPDHRFETTVAYSGSVEDGTLCGDVYIVGGADPTLAADDSIATDVQKVFAAWKHALSQAGISRIEGRVIGDGRYFDGPLEEPSWSFDDLGTYYGCGGNGLAFYENAQDYAASPGPAVGEPARVVILYPKTPWLHCTDRSVTGPAGSGDQVYLFTTDLAPYAEVRGSFAIDRRPRKESFANKYAALTCAYYFCDYLHRTGMTVTGGYADIGRDGRIRRGFASEEPAAPHTALTRAGSTWSPPLKKIIRETNHRSDNFYAETLFRTEGLHETGSACYDSSRVAVQAVLERMGVDCAEGISLTDGSGLSRMNYVSPAFFVRFLRAMADLPEFGDYLRSLPSPGSDGTMRVLLPDAPEAVKSRIFLKSGSMGGVLCYSGYILAADGDPERTVTFSLLVNNCPAPFGVIRAALSDLILALAETNG